MDYRSEDDAILRKVTIDALKRVGSTITRNDTRGTLDVGCSDAGELQMAIQGASILERESTGDVSRRNYYNLGLAISRKLSSLSK
jgi:hypothetical protein